MDFSPKQPRLRSMSAVPIEASSLGSGGTRKAANSVSNGLGHLQDRITSSFAGSRNFLLPTTVNLGRPLPLQDYVSEPYIRLQIKLRIRN